MDATGPTATLDLDVPELVHVRGRISGSLRGPLAGFAVALHSEPTTTVRQTFTDRAGWFEAWILAREAIHVVPSWNDGFESLGWSAGRQLEPALDSAHPVAQYEIAEALLHVVEWPPSPLLRCKPLRMDAVSTSGERRTGTMSIELDVNGRTRSSSPAPTRSRSSRA